METHAASLQSQNPIGFVLNLVLFLTAPVGTAEFFSQNLLPGLALGLRLDMTQELRNVPVLAITADFGTVQCTSLLAVTCHWIDPIKGLASKCLSVRPFVGQHTGQAVCDAVKMLLEQVEVTPDKIVAIVTDNGV